MIDWLLQPNSVFLVLMVLTIATPLVGAYVSLMKNRRYRRLGLVIVAAGPFALVYWGLHNLILAALGFDSIFSVLLGITVCAVIGFRAGRWVSAGITD